MVRRIVWKTKCCVASLGQQNVASKSLPEKKDIILTSTVVFNFPIINPNFINLHKHFYLNEKKLNISEIFDLGLECAWNYRDYEKKNVTLKNNRSSLQADVIEVNIKTNDIKIFMYEENKKVKIKSIK